MKRVEKEVVKMFKEMCCESINSDLYNVLEEQIIPSLEGVRDAKEDNIKILKVVQQEQAKDDGLWFDANTASEAHLQQELRRLHKGIKRL